jgi:hypothetical protein
MGFGDLQCRTGIPGSTRIGGAQVGGIMSQENVTKSEQKSRLYSPISFIPLAFLFSIVLPGILFALNAGRIYSPKSRNYLIVLFTAVGAVLFTALFVFFEKMGNSARVGFFGLNLAIGGLLYTIQRPKYLEYRSSKAKARSLLWPILIAVAAMAVPGTFVVISDVRELGRPAVAQFDDHSNGILYDASIALDEVEKIAGQLRQAEVFRDDSTFQFRLQNEAQRYVLLIPFKEDAMKTLGTEDFMKQLADYINQNGGLKKSLSVGADNKQE